MVLRYFMSDSPVLLYNSATLQLCDYLTIQQLFCISPTLHLCHSATLQLCYFHCTLQHFCNSAILLLHIYSSTQQTLLSKSATLQLGNHFTILGLCNLLLLLYILSPQDCKR